LRKKLILTIILLLIVSSAYGVIRYNKVTSESLNISSLYLKLTGGNLSGNLNVDGNVNITNNLTIGGIVTIMNSSLLDIPVKGSIGFSNDRIYITNVGNQKAVDRTSDVIIETVEVTDTTTETIIFTAPIPANSLKVGNVQKLVVHGLISTDKVIDFCTIRLKAGGVTVATIVNPGKRLDNVCWDIIAHTTVRSLGTSGVVGTKIVMEVDDVTTSSCQLVTLDTTQPLDITITAEWNNADIDNSLTIGQGWLEYKG
jgi:hypothetical protein